MYRPVGEAPPMESGNVARVHLVFAMIKVVAAREEPFIKKAIFPVLPQRRYMVGKGVFL